MSTGTTSLASGVGPDLRYPVGLFARERAGEALADGERIEAVETLAELPELLRNAVEDLDHEQLNTPYREGGWTVLQVVHHLPDSHMNMFIRTRKALTEDWPAITAYDEAAWALLHDATAPAEWSLELVESLHARWVMMLQSLTAEQWARGFVHPETGRWRVDEATRLYAWHSRHHVAHITHLRARMGW